VRGTVFDVTVEDDDATTLVSVEEGQVLVQHSLLPRGDPKIVNAGEWIRVFKNQPLIAKTMDRSGLIRGALRAAAEAMYNVVYRTPTAGGRTPGPSPSPGGGGGVGDKDPKPSPAPPPPPPPPPPSK
jgi:hypothetical protein